MSATPTLSEFAHLAERYTVVPVWRDLLADTETPVGLFRRLGAAEGSVLLESVETGDRWGRFSFIGLDPFTAMLVHGTTVSWTNGPICEVPEGVSLIDTLRAVTRTLRAPRLPDMPPLSPGAFCALGGDALRAGTRRSPLATSRSDLVGVPDSAVLFPSAMVILDHFRQRLRLVANALVRPGVAPELQYAAALSRLDELAARLTTVEQVAPKPVPVTGSDPTFDSDVGDVAFHEMVEVVRRRILAGQARQVNVSRRFVAPAGADPLTVYRVLRITNPSPYMYVMRLPGVTLVGSSPHGLVRVRDSEITTYALAGTRPRGADPAADVKLAAELATDPKEREEHQMLVGLALADLVPIARPGTVRVTDRERIVRYSRVMHLVTEVTGALAPERDMHDALCAVFPPGTVLGAPRSAAARIIDETEARGRGLYGGAVGYLDLSGGLDMCIAVRALQFHQGLAYCQAGAGVLARSVAEHEVEESRAKARALFAALETAAELDALL